MIPALFLILSLSVVAGSIALGGDAGAFASASSALLVLLGTATVTAISLQKADAQGLGKSVKRLFSEDEADAQGMAKQLLDMSHRLRRDGVQAIEGMGHKFRATPLLQRAVTLVADGVAAESVERILIQEADLIAARHRRLADLLARAGDVAPAMGLIGTIIGLVQMLGKLNEPGALGPGLAVALLTTLYGALLAHVVCLPLAARADAQAERDRLINLVCAAGAASLSRRDNPLHMEAALNALLPKHQQVKAA